MGRHYTLQNQIGGGLLQELKARGKTPEEMTPLPLDWQYSENRFTAPAYARWVAGERQAVSSSRVESLNQ